MEYLFELYNLEKLSIEKQNTILKNLTEQKDFDIPIEYIEKLKTEILIHRVNDFLNLAIKAELKPKKKKKRKASSESSS